MKKKTLNVISLLSVLSFLTGCGHAVQPNETYGYQFTGDTVKVMDSQWSRNIQVQQIRTSPYVRTVVTAGTVKPIPTQYAEIASPFSGRLIKSYVRMGQWVRKGTPLFEIICPDFTSAQKDYFQALSEKELAGKDLRRKQDLIQNGVSSRKDLEEAENAFEIAVKDFENAEAALRVYQVEDLTSMTLGQPLVVKAPISGLLIENNIVNGQYLKEEDEAVAVVADLAQVWISAQVKEKDIRYIKEGGDLEVEVLALPGEIIQGTVFHVEEAVDEETRSICVLSECNNPDEKIKLGMYATVKFESDPVDMVTIPETALLQGQKSTYVFVSVGPDSYVRRDVKVENTSGGKAVISEGLEPGEVIIAAGGYYLKE